MPIFMPMPTGGGFGPPPPKKTMRWLALLWLFYSAICTGLWWKFARFGHESPGFGDWLFFILEGCLCGVVCVMASCFLYWLFTPEDEP